MSRIDRNNQPVHIRAIQSHKWIVMGKRWYTPEEFFREHGKGLSLLETSWHLADPFQAIVEAQGKIEKMIQDKKEPAMIIDALNRLYMFYARVFRNFNTSNH